MRDEFDGRLWCDHHQDFSIAVDHGLRKLGRAALWAFERLNAITYDAPWKREKLRKPGCDA